MATASEGTRHQRVAKAHVDARLGTVSVPDRTHLPIMNRHKPAVLLALVVSAVVPVTTASAGVSGSIPPQDTVQAILDDWVAGGSGGVLAPAPLVRRVACWNPTLSSASEASPRPSLP